MSEFIGGIPAGKLAFAYAPGKWTVAQVLGHIIDTQVVFLYRILNISRGEKISLPGFDERIWVENGKSRGLDLEEIGSLYEKASSLTLAFLLQLQGPDLKMTGEANGVTLSVEEIIAYLIAHEMHHSKIIVSRYLGREGRQV